MPSSRALLYRNVRSDPGLKQPAEEFAGTIRRVSSKSFWLEPKALPSPLDHDLARSDLIVGARGRSFHVDNNCVLGIDQIVEAIPELHAFVRFGRPSRAWVSG